MYSKTIALATAILSYIALAASAPTYPNTTVTAHSSQYGEVCESYPLIDADGKGRGYYVCSKVPSGVKVRGVFSDGTSTVYSEWFTDTVGHYSSYVNNAATYKTSIEAEDDEDISKGDCTATRLMQENWFRNKFAVQLKCTKIRKGVKARGVLDLSAQLDDHTNWVDGPLSGAITLTTDWRTPSTLTDPSVRVDYELI